METRDYIVKADVFGTYKKGDVLKMHPSTGEACSKFVEQFKKSKPKK